jgi:phospholipid/cholesterol/gamma-HCH transport system substrate-binding protein
MNFKFKHTEKIVGFFVLLALVVMIAGIVMVAVSRKVFVKSYRFHTLLSDASGLSTSTSLDFKGYKIGKVKRFFLDVNNNIDVELAVYGEYLGKMIVGSAIYRQTNPISGETSLVLLMPRYPGSKPPPVDFGRTQLLPEGSYLPSLDMPEGQQLLEQNLIEKSGESISLIFDEAKVFFSHLRKEFKLKEDSFRTFFKKLGDVSDSLARNREIFDHLNLLLNPDNGPVFKTVKEFSQVSRRLNETIDHLEEVLKNYKDPDGLMLKMLSMDRNQLEQTLENINKNLLTMQEMLQALKDQSPMVAEFLDRSRKTLEAINNNPLLRGGISKDKTPANSSRKKRLDIDEEK